jgi:dTDP-4-dehydrorhamnose reductase
MKRRLLVTGATGHLGSYLMRELATSQFEVLAWSHSAPSVVAGTDAVAVDLTDADGLGDAFKVARPDVVIHAAAMANPANCFEDRAQAVAVNALGTASVSKLCDAYGARLVYVSTDLVFDGERGHYSVADPVAPTSVYGQTKVTGELAVLASDRNVVVRVSWMFGPSLNGRKSFFVEQMEALRGGPTKSLFHDEWRTPLALHTAAGALIGIAMSEVTGILHVGGPERMSRWEVGQRLGTFLKLGTTGLQPVSRLANPGREPRPRDVSLESTRWRDSFPKQPWPTYEQALSEMGVG